MSIVGALQRAPVFIKEAEHAVQLGDWLTAGDATTNALSVLIEQFKPGTRAEAEAYRELDPPEPHQLYLAKALAAMRHAVNGAAEAQKRVAAAHESGSEASPADMDEVRNCLAWVFETGRGVQASADELA